MPAANVPPSLPRPQTLTEAWAALDALQRLVAQLQARNASLEARVAELEAQLRQNATNSSRPPSSDAPGIKAARAKRTRSGRKPGGQPGHTLAERPLVPAAEVTATVACIPAVCQHCHARLTGRDPDPFRHQVTAIPRVRAETYEYQLHTLTCPRCRQATQGALPAGVPTQAFGPRLQAVIAVNSGAYHLSKRQTQQQLADTYGVALSLGTISALEQATSAALAAPVEEARAYVRAQDDVHLDETGWRQGNGPKKAWLWTALTAWVTTFAIRLSRGGAVVKELLGEHFAGIVHSDRWSAYNWLANAQRQLCWAHLGRDFQALVDLGGEAARIGQRLLDLREQMFAWWHRVRDGTLHRGFFRMEMVPVIRAVGELLRQGAACAQPKARGMCADILKREAALWTFVWRTGVEPTTNTAERAVRPAVLWRKGSFGTQGPAGSEFVARILTVVATCRQQQRNVLEYVTAACAAAHGGKPAPSLLPTAEVLQAAHG